jgi:serine phosphatase RsbU (regulator of sigma subunit)
MRPSPEPDYVSHQRLRLLFAQAHTASYLALLSAVVCAVVFWQVAPGQGPLIWLGGVMLATAFRFWLYWWFSAADIRRFPEAHWLRHHSWTAALIGMTWGALPLIPLEGGGGHLGGIHLHELQTLVPAFVLMAAITSYGVYFSQYLILLTSISVTTVAARLYMGGIGSFAEVLLFALFVPLLALTARRYGASLIASAEATLRSEQLVTELTRTNDQLQQHNSTLAQQQHLLEQEEALAQHVFAQLVLGGDHRLPGVHAWNQPMGSLSGDLTHTARGPDGQTYVFLGDFTGHGLPAALGALPASLVFLAMAGKGLAVETIAGELNTKLTQLLPVGYFCCAVLLELSPDRRTAQVWNGGLPPILIRRSRRGTHEHLRSHSLPLGVVDADTFDPTAHQIDLEPDDLLYAYSDGLTEAENSGGEMWGAARLERFLLRDDLPTPRLPALIDTILDYVKQAPATDDISVLEIEASPRAAAEADAA